MAPGKADATPGAWTGRRYTAVGARRTPGGCLPRHAGRCSPGVAPGPGGLPAPPVDTGKSRRRAAPLRWHGPCLLTAQPHDAAPRREMRMETVAYPAETRPRKKEPYAALLHRLSHQSVVKHFDAYADVDWEAAEHRIDPEDPRWELGDDTLADTAWY
ncbi:MAG: diiron oxygenase, partial [Deltaproteobacteria bacterium]